MSITADGNIREGVLGRAHSSADVGIPTGMIEQLRSLSHNKAKKPLQKSFGDSSPVGGFLLCATPASLSLLEFQGAGGFAAAANVGAYLGLGSLLLVLGGIGEWIVGKRMTTAGFAETDFLGNTFYSSVFCLFGGFWLTFGITINPSSGAYGMYSTTANPVSGLDNPPSFMLLSPFF
ncbi:hypothetical protein FAVG1_06868 [Fusarium avenaceum]|nr:hypothetical protein FAVG1_06868 [Fusarium avenaceum]